MSFPFNLYLMAILSALACTVVSMSLWSNWCRRAGLVDDPGHRKIHDTPTPLAGGLAVLTGLLIPVLTVVIVLGLFRSGLSLPCFDAVSSQVLRHGLGRKGEQIAAILAGAVGMTLVGCLDDRWELSPRIKLAGQLLVALLVAASGLRITLFVPNLVFSYVVTVFWILTVINAFNFMDNMNGLCSGLAAIGAWYFGMIAASAGQYLVALVSFLTFGALAGFLPFNFPRGRVFLGDAGSHLCGYLLAVLAILPHFHSPENPNHWAVVIPLLVLSVPLIDMGWVVVLRWNKGLPFYQGDTNHLSHRLVRAGMSRTGAVLLIWGLATLAGSLSFLF
jgi:UDP-GlcNAc:undecaprenyl-phosphate GlcNAc-1-phosphate transferase